ncbi:MAG: sialate O-acetylesterase [Bacteroidales bacterium]
MISRISTVLLIAFSLMGRAQDKARFATIFTDNMVLQQNSKVKLWGYAQSNENLTINCNWLNTKIQIKANSEGNWNVDVNTPSASFKPYTISLTDSKESSVTLSNVMIGEVWLCSGQSNMEMVLQNFPEWNLIVENSEEEIAKANYPYIRMVTIGRKESFDTLNEVDPKGGWKICDSNNAKWFSAVAYFFGKDLFQELNVPIGLVVSAYGGSPIQSWLPLDVMKNNPIYADRILQRNLEMEALNQTEEQYINAMKSWIDESEESTSTNVTKNTILNLPINFEKADIGNQMGEVSLTRTINISEAQKGQDIQVSLGTMDDLGRILFNGEVVWEEVRNSHSYSAINFTIPSAKVKTGENVIEAKVLNILWGGGLTGPADKMYYTIGSNSQRISLTGEWSFSKIFDLYSAKPIPREGKPLYSNAAALYNGMIYPIINYKFKGCVWYQGEENVSEYQNYTEMLTNLIAAWRKDFCTELPFYYVQIAPYCYNGHAPFNATKMRDAQAVVEHQVPTTGMVVTLDLGEPNNIHPAKKKEVGNRLAKIALAKTYGKKVACEYPIPTKAKLEKGSVIIAFTNTYNGLSANGKQHDFELSDDGINFWPATVTITSKQIKLSNPNIKNPQIVRYCWHDAAMGTIFNSENLPLASFKMEVSL